MRENPIPARPHTLTSADRKTLALTGITDVDSFDDREIVAYTDLGGLTVCGEGLHVSRLSLGSGELELEGHIRSLTYSDAGTRRKGLLGKLLR
ncbi:MAG: sporulation protein YabP [Clostridia bacterium]|nr:sporulation protein YabP [Clostridia bacterium]